MHQAIRAVASVPREAWGLGLGVAALVAASLFWLPDGGPASQSLRAATKVLVGPGSALLPLFLAWSGLEFLRSNGRPLRSVIGWAGLFLGLSLLLAVWSASPVVGSHGWVGAKLGSILLAALGRPAALATAIAAFLALVTVGFRIPLWRPAARAVAEVERIISILKLKGTVSESASGTLAQAETSEAPVSGGSNSTDAEHQTMPEPPTQTAPDLEARRVQGDPSTERRRRERDSRTGQLRLGIGEGTSSAYPTTRYELPPLSLLREGSGGHPSRGSLAEVGRVLIETLRQFDVEASLAGITPGPTVTRFEVELAPGVKVSKVKGLTDDIAYALAAESVRIQAPIPGKSAIGIEIPNRDRRLVTLADVLKSQAGSSPSHPLDCALGKDISGKPVWINLSQMPHLLIAGTTGGGKSSTINALVSSLIMRNGPEQVRLLLVDPKRVELGVYDGIPHLLTPVVTNPKRASEALGWVVREMELRYEKLAELGARDIASYNASLSAAGGELEGETFQHSVMGFIVVVVDELNDLMMVAAREVEDSIMRLAQMARAVGIHLVIATQRPSTNVITGVIKANIPSRIAFKVGSQVDSRVILDTGGAEELVGMGDMLLLTASSGVPRRIQGCFVSEEEVRKIVAHWRRQVPKPDYLDDTIFSGTQATKEVDEEDDDLLQAAMDLVVQTQLGSTSMLQRKLRVGFARAGRLMDLLERRGVVGPSEGSKARAVLISPEEYEAFKRRQATSGDKGNDSD